MSKVNVVAFTRLTPEALELLRDVSPERVNIIEGWDEFRDEILDGWPEDLKARSGGSATQRRLSDSERELTLAAAGVALIGYPYPRRLLARMPSLRWVHLAGAGVSSLAGSEWWAGPVPTTSSRGHTNADLIAETAMAAVLTLAKGLDRAAVNSSKGDLALAAYRQPRRVAGKTLAVVGAGGIGLGVARLARASGMRVVGLSRSAGEPGPSAELDMLYGPSGLKTMLQQADFLVIAAMLTEETRGMIAGAELGELKAGAFLINVARGEIVDERALGDALTSGQLAGAYLDVWTDDMASPPAPELLAAPNVVFTPHISGRSEVPGTSSLQFFCENLARYARGDPLENLVDWSRGY